MIIALYTDLGSQKTEETNYSDIQPTALLIHAKLLHSW